MKQDKSKLAEDMLGVTRQLAIVRENNEMQAKELNQVGGWLPAAALHCPPLPSSR